MLTKIKKYANFDKFSVCLIIISLIVILIFKLMFISNFMLIISTFLYEFAIFAFILSVTLLINSNNKRFARIFFFISYILNMLLFVLWSYFLDLIVGRKVSIYSINLDVVSFVISKIINLKYIFLILFGIIILFLVCIFISKYFFKLKRRILIILLFGSLFLGLFTPIVFQDNFDNFYNNSFNLFFQKVSNNNQKYDLNYNCNLNIDFLEKKNYPDLNLDSKYSKIVVFVMEEVLFDNFYKYQKKIQKEYNFYEQNKLNSHYYFNYYTNNQDSTTSIISMISSKFIPNEAYIYNESYSLCAHNLYFDYDLVDLFNDYNYYTVFYVSSIQPGCELTKYSWKNIVDISGRFEDLKKTNMCFNPFPYDTACEDKVLLNKLIQDLNKEKVFIMQEFIFGHNNLYQKTSKKSKTEYYNEYFYEFYQKILENNWEDDLLIILVSDHGNKGIQAYSNLQGYNIPLIFVANDLNYLENYDLLSHLDFKDILLKYNFNIDFNPSKEFFIVGPTASNVFGYVNNVFWNIFKKELNYVSLINGNVLDLQEELNCFLYYQREFNKGITMP